MTNLESGKDRLLQWMFRIGLLLVAAAGVFAYWERRDERRYVYNSTGSDYWVFDTRTGTIFTLLNAGQGEWQWVEGHPQTGRAVARKLSQK